MIRLLFAAALWLAPVSALAHDYKAGGLVIGHPFITATAPNAPVAGGYMTITNEGADDVLLSASVPVDIAGMVQLHESSMADGVMRMQPVDGGIPIPSGETVVLESGGLHLMLMRLPEGLDEGDLVPATLTFRDAGEIHVVFLVEPRGEGAVDHSDHGS
ncbi:MAG: copper chaperone PCu(A)C [Pseudomonadota bacterium]